MRFTVVTILPELIEPSLTAGVVGRAREAGVITVDSINPRDFTKDKHRTVDDTPYGGGPGMVMKAEPLLAAIARASEPAPVGQGASHRDAAAAGSPSGPGATDVLGQPRDPLAKVEAALAKVQALVGGLDDVSRPLTAAQHHERMDAAVADAEATLAEIEGEMRREVLEHSLSPVADAPRVARRPASDAETKPTELIDEDIDLGLPQRRNDRIGSLGPAGESTPTATSPTAAPQTASVAGASPRTRNAPPTDEMPHLVPRANVAGAPDIVRAADTSGGAALPAAAVSSATADPHLQDASAGQAASAGQSRPHRILLSPSGTPLTQARVRELAKLEHLVLVCGRYEGVDQRVIDLAIDEELSIGDYVLSGGELGALVIIDAVARLVPGVLGEPTSADDESFSAGLLEYPQYTRPQELTASAIPPAFADRTASAVPPVLQSGNHAAIHAWRRQQAMQRTAARRPDLWRHVRTSKADDKLFAPLRARTHVALVHHPIVDRTGAVITTALTNFDIHDLARSSLTYGLAGYHIVTPITSQREKAEHIASLWMADEQGEHRAQALRLIRTAESVDAVIATLTAEHGQAPTVVATSARAESFPAAARRTSSELLAEASGNPAPVLLLLGTGWGLADSLIPSVSRVLAPIEGASDWNHLSVRSAGAVILDRLFGRPA